MANVLIVAEQQSGQLKRATLHAVGAGRDLARRAGGKLTILVMGKGAGALAEELAAHGDVLLADHPALEHHLAESHTPVVVAAVKATGATLVGAAATAFGKDLLPRVACRLEAAMATEVLAFTGEGGGVGFVRPMWAGNVVAEVELATPVKVFTVRPTEFPAATPAAARGAVTPLPVEVDAGALRAKFVEFREVKSERPELTEARVVVSGGRGTKGDFKEVEALADELGAAVGASRAAVDAGWVPNDWQVGQTGKVVAPELYVAVGISGAIQHVAGMKGAKVIVAVNKDPDAPIFQLADYGLVADLFKALPELRSKVKAAK